MRVDGLNFLICTDACFDAEFAVFSWIESISTIDFLLDYDKYARFYTGPVGFIEQIEIFYLYFFIIF